MGGDRYILKSNTAEPYIIFFREIEKEQYYFEKSFNKLKKQLYDWEHHDYKASTCLEHGNISYSHCNPAPAD